MRRPARTVAYARQRRNNLLRAVLLTALAGSSALILLGRIHLRRHHGLDGPGHAPAREVVAAFPLAHTPTVATGPYRYAVLGVGQDGSTGRQVIWMRDLSDAKVGRFAAGEPVFEGPVKIASLTPRKLTLVYHQHPTEVVIHP